MIFKCSRGVKARDLFIVKPKNKETLSVSPGRFGFLGETPYQKHRTDAECPINSKLYYNNGSGLRIACAVVAGLHASEN